MTGGLRLEVIVRFYACWDESSPTYLQLVGRKAGPVGTMPQGISWREGRPGRQGWRCSRWYGYSARLSPRLLLLELNRSGTCLDQRILNWSSHFNRKDRSRVHRARDGFLPGLQHLLQFLPDGSVHESVGIHVGLVQIPAEEKGIWGSDVLNDGIENVQGW